MKFIDRDRVKIKWHTIWSMWRFKGDWNEVFMFLCSSSQHKDQKMFQSNPFYGTSDQLLNNFDKKHEIV